VPSPCVGETVSEVFWREFLRSIVARGLSGVLLGVTAIHESLTRAIVQVVGCPWQRCPVHVLRDVQGLVHRSQRRMVAAVIRQVFAAAEPGKLRSRLADVVATLEAAAPKVALLLEAAEEELLAFMSFPREHWPKLRSTNPLERLNKEIARRSDVVGIYPNDASLIRLAGALLLEQNDEWLVGRRYLSGESLAGLYAARQADEPQRSAPSSREVVLLTTR
jgi:transposase-like protein